MILTLALILLYVCVGVLYGWDIAFTALIGVSIISALILLIYLGVDAFKSVASL